MDCILQIKMRKEGSTPDIVGFIYLANKYFYFFSPEHLLIDLTEQGRR